MNRNGMPFPTNSAAVRLTILDILGNRVKVLLDGHRMPGEYAAQWDGTNDVGNSVAGGTYVCILELQPTLGGPVVSSGRSIVLVR